MKIKQTLTLLLCLALSLGGCAEPEDTDETSIGTAGHDLLSAPLQWDEGNTCVSFLACVYPPAAKG